MKKLTSSLLLAGIVFAGAASASGVYFPTQNKDQAIDALVSYSQGVDKTEAQRYYSQFNQVEFTITDDQAKTVLSDSIVDFGKSSPVLNATPLNPHDTLTITATLMSIGKDLSSNSQTPILFKYKFQPAPDQPQGASIAFPNMANWEPVL